ncbi:MAG: LAGLIDADG family homing endonuclease [Patescibacteria group bacterium]
MEKTEKEELPSLDFIAGLIAGEGSFLWIHQNGSKIPVFQLRMHACERPLFELIKRKLNLDEKIYEYTHQGRHSVLLMVRKRSTLEDIIIPVFNGRLFGKKAAQFELWKEIFLIEKFEKFGLKIEE